ncbi:MAG: type 4a pilus biogenesis protein PilO [Chlorobia bacterium]|nr:type 4a pilus biogenesis protein PilO [Fimbriimonadaceae bacterium]
MISFRTKSDTGVSVAIIIAITVLVVTGLVMLFVPAPTTAGIASGKIRSQKELDERLAKLEKDKRDAKAMIVSQVWKVPIAEVGPKALAFITSFAQRQNVKLLAFRPQKIVEVNGLNQLPFLITIEGPYPGVMKFVKDLEAPALKVGTSLVQVTGSDPSTDTVSATVGIVAYKQLEIKSASKGKTNASKKEN